MGVKDYSEVGIIQKRITAADAGNIITIYQAPTTAEVSLPSGVQLLKLNSFLKNLRAVATIPSLAEVQLPNFLLEDSETQKLYKVLDVEWSSPRKQLDVYLSNSSSAEWVFIGAVSLLNPSGYLYRSYTLMDLITDGLAAELGAGSKIGCAVEDVGTGFLTPTDQVVIHGSFVKEFIVYSPPETIIMPVSGSAGGGEEITSDTVTAITNSLSTESSIICPANPNRIGLTITNTLSDRIVYIDQIEGVTATQWKARLEPGQLYELPFKNEPYRGAFYGICESGTGSAAVREISKPVATPVTV